jgi:hypothetical protein
MTTDLDIYRTANLLIGEHGDQAAIEAAQRADARLEKGDMNGKMVWLRVLRAVRELQDRERAAHGRSAVKAQNWRCGS